MTSPRRKALAWWGALGAGVVLFAVTLYFADFSFLRAGGRGAALAVALAIAASGAWHLARTWAWSRAFPRPGAVRFARLARVRIAAEAFSYLTIRGVAGEPLKVWLLGRDIDAREATAAVALERIAFIIGTLVIVGAGSIAAITMQALSRTWFMVFLSFAAVAGAAALLVAMVVAGRAVYVAAALRMLDGAIGTRIASGRVGRFAADVEGQLLQVVRQQPARLAALMAATVAAYAFMCAEVWLIMRAVGIPMSVGGAVAIETFSRVVSFATVLIPANLGGLEASSLAAAAAMGAAGGGAPLAFARRLRGLFWAGAGLALYPRLPRASGQAGATLLYVPADPAVRVSPFDRIAGLPIAERAMRAAFKAGYARVMIVAEDDVAARLRRIASRVSGEIRIVSPGEWRAAITGLAGSEVVTVMGAGTVVSPALLEDAALRGTEGDEAVDVPAGAAWPVSGVLRMTAAAAADLAAVSRALHARLEAPQEMPAGEEVSCGRARLALRARDAAELAAGERAMRASVIKSTDNKVARWNRKMSLPVSIALIRTPLTANQFSIALVAVGFYAGWLYSLGTYGSMVLASVLGLAASIADGCDGEIARLKYQESALGCWIETVGDYSYYIAIFIGMTMGVARWTGMPVVSYWLGGFALGGTLLSFALLIYLRSAATGGRPEQWGALGKERFNSDPSLWTRAVWKVMMVATRSFMPYFILGLAVLGLMPLVLLLAAVGANVFWISLVAKMRVLTGGPENGDGSQLFTGSAGK